MDYCESESDTSGLVPTNALGAMDFRGTHLILELWRYADLAGLIPPWKPDSFRLAEHASRIVGSLQTGEIHVACSEVRLKKQQPPLIYNPLLGCCTHYRRVAKSGLQAFRYHESCFRRLRAGRGCK